MDVGKNSDVVLPEPVSVCVGEADGKNPVAPAVLELIAYNAAERVVWCFGDQRSEVDTYYPR